MLRSPIHRVLGPVALGLVLLASWAAAPVSAQDPQVTDPADDAYRYPENPLGQFEPKPSVAMLSNEAADLISATFAPASSPRSDHNGAYSITLTLTGEPHPTYNYLVGGEFGDNCVLAHFLGAGKARDAFATCGGKYLATMTGSVATVKGNTVSATFSFRRFALPSALRDEIQSFYAGSCPAEGDSYGCTSENWLDWAVSEGTFRI